MATDYTTQITTWYQDVQFRNPPAADLATYNAALSSGALTTAQVQTLIIDDPFTTSIVNVVIREYQAAFGRVPDQAGLNYWVDAVAANSSMLSQLNTIFANSAEFQARFGANASTTANSALVSSIYQQVYNRAPDAAGLAYWAGSGLNAAQLLQAFANSAEYISLTSAAIKAYEQLELTGTEPTTGSLFNVPGVPAVTINLSLTPSADTVNGSASDETLNATLLFNTPSGTYVQTLQSTDSINLGGGNDVANVELNTLGTVQPASFKGVETLNITAIGTGTNGTTGINLTNGDNLLTTITDANSGANSVNILNSQSKVATVNISNAGQAGNIFTLTTANSALSGSTDAVTVNLQSVTGGGTITLNPVSGSNGYETLTLNSTGGIANVLGAVTATGATKEIITGSTNLTYVDGSPTDATVDASAFTGVLDYTASAGAGIQTITGGSGNDLIRMVGTLTTADKIDAGAGTDTLFSTDANITAVTAAANANITHVETLGLTDAMAGTVNVNNITDATGLTLANGTATATLSVINYAAGTDTLTLGSSTQALATDTLNVNIAGTATTDVLNVTAGTSAGGGAGANYIGTVTISGAETVNLNAIGGAETFNVLTLTPTAANETLNITGTQAVTFTGAVTADTINASAMTGTTAALNLNGGVLAAGGAAITGTLNADVLIGSGANDIINGGGGNDTINGGAGADIITTGAGTDAVSILSTAQTQNGFTALDTTAANIEAVTDFVGNGNAAGDSFVVDSSGALDFTAGAGTTATVTAVSVATAANFAAIYAAVAGTASTVTNAQVYDITVTAGALAGHYVVINDGTAALAATDTIVNVTGITGALNAQDFTFV